jgi:hypothetical protein
LTDIGFLLLVFPDIEMIYWTVNGHWNGLDLNRYQSTSGTKIEAYCMPDKSRFALFFYAVITFTFVELLTRGWGISCWQVKLPADAT